MVASLHAYICMFEWIGCFSGFIYGCTATDDYPWLWYTCLIGIFALPIFNEALLCLKGFCCKSRFESPD